MGTGNKLALDCTTQQEAGEGSEVALKLLSQDKNIGVEPVCPGQGTMSGAGGLLDVPLHHDEEERSIGSHSATEDKRARTPMVRFLWRDDPGGWMPDCVIGNSCGKCALSRFELCHE